MARAQGFDCYALSLDYGQRHHAELAAAGRVAGALGVSEHKVLPLSLDAIGGSALTDSSIDVPEAGGEGIPVTYVPARNTVFLALALGWAEVLGATDLFVGVNAVDYSGYPDCRPAFIEAFERLANLATKAGVEGGEFKVHAPLIEMSKAEIIRAGTATGRGLCAHRVLLPGGRGGYCLRLSAIPVACVPRDSRPPVSPTRPATGLEPFSLASGVFQSERRGRRT